MRNLTQEEYDQRALMQMHFVSYYKYDFTFESDYFNGKKVVATMGGTSADIYRASIHKDCPMNLEEFDIENCRWE